MKDMMVLGGHPSGRSELAKHISLPLLFLLTAFGHTASADLLVGYDFRSISSQPPTYDHSFEADWVIALHCSVLCRRISTQ